MANSLYNLFNRNSNPIFNLFGGQQNFQQRFSSFVNQFNQSGGGSPEQIVRQMVSSGRMTQEQFNQFSAIANQITGRKM